MRPIFSAFLFLTLIILSHVQAQQNEVDPDKILQEQRTNMLMRQAMKFYNSENYENALIRLDALPAEAKITPDALNLRGAIHTKLKNYDEARKIFTGLTRAYPKYLLAAFNVGELQFIEGDYEEALKTFNTFLERNPTNELVRFRVIVCNLKLDQLEQAREVGKGLNSAGGTPAWYYAQAMFARHEGNAKAEAKYLDAAHSIYEKIDCKPFDDVLAQEVSSDKTH